MSAIVHRAAFAVLLIATAVSGQTAPPQNAHEPTISEKIAADKLKLDVNTATATQLEMLPGITPFIAQRIIDGRPYKQKLDLLRRGVLTRDQYNAIWTKIIAHRVKASTPAH